MTTARAKHRANLVAEIKTAARDELVTAGAAALSLRAVARRVGVVPSAIYRYFDGRDALLTALILDAYQAIGERARAADAGAGRSPLRRWLAVGHALRDWAWQHPHEWSLVYGTPVPGYRAPRDTVDVAMGTVRVLAGIVAAASPQPKHLPVVPPMGRELRAWVRRAREPYLHGLPDEVVPLAVQAFDHLIGSISLELFGQYGEQLTPAPALFDHGLRTTAALLGFGAAADRADRPC